MKKIRTLQNESNYQNLGTSPLLRYKTTLAGILYCSPSPAIMQWKSDQGHIYIYMHINYIAHMCMYIYIYITICIYTQTQMHCSSWLRILVVYQYSWLSTSKWLIESTTKHGGLTTVNGIEAYQPIDANIINIIIIIIIINININNFNIKILSKISMILELIIMMVLGAPVRVNQGLQAGI